MPRQLDGFWGAPTSTIDWCESNYAITPYVAEFFNTVSSLAIVAVAVAGIVLHIRLLERRFLAAFAAVAVVGAGSAAFHATLRFGLQMLDELPMLYSALIMVYILTERRPKRRFGVWFPWLLCGHGLLITLLTSLTQGPVQFYSFHISFGTLELFALVRVFQISRSHAAAKARGVFWFGMCSYLIGIVVWLVDLRYCNLVSIILPQNGIPYLEFHSVWHVLVALGFYHLLVFLAYDRLVILGELPKLTRTPLGLVKVTAGGTPC